MSTNWGLKKEPSYSWIQVKIKVHEFIVVERLHPQREEIYKKSEELIGKIKDAGYVLDTSFLLHDVDQEHKEIELSHHSEKLAFAFGIISMLFKALFRVFKKLRLCGDFHNAIKFSSKIIGWNYCEGC